MKNELQYWERPKVRSVGFYSDYLIYIEVLMIAQQLQLFTKDILRGLLVNYVKGLTYKGRISDTGLENLLKELSSFGWIVKYDQPLNTSTTSIGFDVDEIQSGIYLVTEKGKNAFIKYTKNKDSFFIELIEELYKLYIIPGWFIQRLWDLNPKGQGLLIIPAPNRNWRPEKKDWNDNNWYSDLTNQVEYTYYKIQQALPNAFPVDKDVWLEEIHKRWVEISSTQPRIKDKAKKYEFTPRKRLAVAMKESAIRVFFSNENPISGYNDFEDNVNPLLPRLYSYWSKRLEEIGLLNYTDYNRYLPGRILYPVCSYNEINANNENFKVIKGVKNNNNNSLVLHRPKWELYKIKFYNVLYAEYKRVYLKVKSLYVSVQEVRDEVCRVLRLSNFTFDIFLEKASEYIDEDHITYRIALETDIREDQRQSLQRRPVYVRNNIISLISITDK